MIPDFDICKDCRKNNYCKKLKPDKNCHKPFDKDFNAKKEISEKISEKESSNNFWFF